MEARREVRAALERVDAHAAMAALELAGASAAVHGFRPDLNLLQDSGGVVQAQ